MKAGAPGRVSLRIHGPTGAAALVYLPGLHGDWTLIGSFRRAVAGRVRFVEVTYPRTAVWSLDEYACGVREALAAAGIARGWLLAESFGSQVAWALLAAGGFVVDGLVLAGGFVRHPYGRLIRGLARAWDALPYGAIRCALRVYAAVAPLRHRHAPETRADVPAFVARRTAEDKAAAGHRMVLVAGNDPRALAAAARLPVYQLTGGIDPVVPWGPVTRWLARHCPGYRGRRVLWPADHNVLATLPGPAAQLVLAWMGPGGVED